MSTRTRSQIICFFFLVFKKNLEYIWFSNSSFFDLNAYFMWIFPCGTSEKIWRISEIFKKKVPKFLNFVGTKKFSFFSVILKLALLFDFCFGFNALQCLRYWRKFFKCLGIWIFCEDFKNFCVLKQKSIFKLIFEFLGF